MSPGPSIESVSAERDAVVAASRAQTQDCAAQRHSDLDRHGETYGPSERGVPPNSGIARAATGPGGAPGEGRDYFSSLVISSAVAFSAWSRSCLIGMELMAQPATS